MSGTSLESKMSKEEAKKFAANVCGDIKLEIDTMIKAAHSLLNRSASDDEMTRLLKVEGKPMFKSSAAFKAYCDHNELYYIIYRTGIRKALAHGKAHEVTLEGMMRDLLGRALVDKDKLAPKMNKYDYDHMITSFAEITHYMSPGSLKLDTTGFQLPKEHDAGTKTLLPFAELVAATARRRHSVASADSTLPGSLPPST